MNFSIYILLSIANFRGKVKIKSNYKHLEFLTDKNWIDNLPDGTWGEVCGYSLPNYGDYYSITTDGKSELFTFRTVVVTRIFSFIALMISILSFLYSFIFK